MNGQLLIGVFGVLVSLVGLVSGLIGAYVSLQNRALLAEVRAELAEMEVRVVTRLNGNYVRSREHQLGMESVNQRLDSLERELRLAMRKSQET